MILEKECVAKSMGKSWFFFAAFVLTFLVDFFVPKSSFLRIENSWYESLQYIILGIGFCLAWKDILRGVSKEIKILGWAAAPAWLVILGREINWGNVYFSYPNAYKYWIAYPIVTGLILFSCFLIFRYHMIRNIIRMIRSGDLPISECISLLLLVLGHYVGEKMLNSSFIEMTMEFFCYLNLLWIVLRIRNFYRSFPDLVR